jgi:Fe-S cluster assembly ATP-binding protein
MQKMLKKIKGGVMTTKLSIKNLHVNVGAKRILKGVNLTIRTGEVHALMGPNGSGKSTLSNAIAGNPKYRITKGAISLNNKNITRSDPDERARNGLFMTFQNPPEISGVSVANFLRTARNSTKARLNPIEFHQLLKEKMKILDMKDDFAKRHINEGFSGGEKKRSEILQMAMLEPKIAILDEIDSGLDIDSLRKVSENINTIAKSGTGFLIITHYKRILDYIKPDFVHIIVDGKIVKSGDAKLAQHLEKYGYGWIENGG